jgi:hypothetical protein
MGVWQAGRTSHSGPEKIAFRFCGALAFARQIFRLLVVGCDFRPSFEFALAFDAKRCGGLRLDSVGRYRLSTF